MKRLGVVVSILVVALISSLVARVAIVGSEDPLVIVHWANSHPMREGLLPEMAEEFNDANHETASGQPIEIRLVACDSADQTDDLVARVAGSPLDSGCLGDDGFAVDDPTIVTPQSDDWLIDVNNQAKEQVINVSGTDSIAETYLGIVTYKTMAECLGWPNEPFGYLDLMDLAKEPGWNAEAYRPCADAKWTSEVLLAFTNPRTSTSGRNVLVSLYAMATGKLPEQLTPADIADAHNQTLVRDFQTLVDHYAATTAALNSQINAGPSEGQFFLMPEDNLVSLYQGNEDAIVDGTKQPIPKNAKLKMIYPKEGSVLNSNPAGLVDAPWVSDDESAAARDWVRFLREEDQQQRFMDAGFRPASGTGLTVNVDQFAAWGLDANQPETVIEPGALKPAVLEQILSTWGSVKKPSIVTFVVDTSESMRTNGALEQVKDGLDGVLDAMAGSEGAHNKVGLVTFNEDVLVELPPTPLGDSKLDISDEIHAMEPRGTTALYDAVQRAIELTNQAAGDGSTRAVVVLSDGLATDGDVCLDDIVSMRVREEEERSIDEFCGGTLIDGGMQPKDDQGENVEIDDVYGVELRLEGADDVQVFFVGFGKADIRIGRILTEATGAGPQYLGKADEDLAAVIEALSGYF